MRKLIINLFIELYHFQLMNWGENHMAILTSLLILSGLQFLNVGCLLMVVQNITAVDIFYFLSENKIFTMLIMTSILSIDIYIMHPIPKTIEQNSTVRTNKLWVYILATILLLVLCVIWIVYNNEKN